MGLDISQKADKSSFRFNWTAVESFKDWNRKNNLPSPFPGWEGGNDGNPLRKNAVRSWVKKIEEMYPEETSMNPGLAMREIAFSCANLDNENYSKEDRDWDKWTAISWYFYLKFAKKLRKIRFY